MDQARFLQRVRMNQFKRVYDRWKHKKVTQKEAAEQLGMMIHQDASTHEWVPGKVWDLVVTMDDATGEIYSAFFIEQEGTWSAGGYSQVSKATEVLIAGRLRWREGMWTRRIRRSLEER